MRTIFCVKRSNNNHIVRFVQKNYIIRTCLMYHAACKVEFRPFKRSYSQLTFFNFLTKSGIPGWFLNKMGYLFFRDGARLRTSAKRLQNAFWRLNPLRLVCAQHPKPFFRCSTPQNSANDGVQKVLSTNNPILFRNTPGIRCPVLRFYKPSDFVHTAQRKIFHTTGKLPTVTTVMQPQQHC